MANKFYKVLLQTLFNSNILTENTVSDLDTQQLISQLRKIVNAEDFYIEPKRKKKLYSSLLGARLARSAAKHPLL